MPIKIGILCVPAIDEVALDVVRRSLQQHLAAALIIQESSVRNQRHWLVETLRSWCDDAELDLIITIGGTLPAPGPGNAELVPEATQAILERNLPGLAEEMRAIAREQSLLALLDRSMAGIRGRTLVLNLPAGAGAALLFLEAVVELIEPILAHLQERQNAPRLADVFPLAISEDGAALTATMPNTTESLPRGAGSSKLHADEFAVFLQRAKPQS
jgi:molybdopterin biosynthesis enzyme MoaB